MAGKLAELVKISHFYGSNKDYVVAGGGNTSYKDKNFLYVKASGTMLGSINEAGFIALDSKALAEIPQLKLSKNSTAREVQVKQALLKARKDPEQTLRPSVEATLHALIEYAYVVHDHPFVVNSLLCAKNAAKTVNQLFGDKVLYVGYTDPGYVLAMKLKKMLDDYKARNGSQPNIIFLENHGMFVSADSPAEVKKIHTGIEKKIGVRLKKKLPSKTLAVPDFSAEVLPGIRMMLSTAGLKVLKTRNDALIEYFLKSNKTVMKAALPFTPDHIVYCKAYPLYIDAGNDPETILVSFEKGLDAYRKVHPYDPKVILIKGIGMIACDDSARACDTVLDMYYDLMKIAWASEAFGGPSPMDQRSIDFIDNWEGENYRRKIAQGSKSGGLTGKIAVVTGGAQGFGGGIVDGLVAEGANVIIADLNAEVGLAKEAGLKSDTRTNQVCFIKSNVADEASVQALVSGTVKVFGGLDLFISNAGILHAGSLDQINKKTFDLMTQVNYTAYFLCTKYASAVMKLQNRYKVEHYMDIIQINSKSGLKGSNRNFAYAGGKFGGIGLTQSFALELIPYNIKVNSVCPGNFFEGPLWADPRKGLFVQYLKAGKVKGAKTIEDVKRFYELQVPAKRGCTTEDVMKAISYIVSQEYETGQAVPVTGGQEMLN